MVTGVKRICSTVIWLINGIRHSQPSHAAVR
jgi:hypothetical protein